MPAWSLPDWSQWSFPRWCLGRAYIKLVWHYTQRTWPFAFVLGWYIAKSVLSLSRVWLFVIHGLQPAQLLCPWRFSRQEYWSRLHALLQGIFPTQGSNPSLPHCRQILYHLSHQGSPEIRDESWKKECLVCPLAVVIIYFNYKPVNPRM